MIYRETLNICLCNLNVTDAALARPLRNFLYHSQICELLQFVPDCFVIFSLLEWLQKSCNDDGVDFNDKFMQYLIDLFMEVDFPVCNICLHWLTITIGEPDNKRREIDF